VYVTVLKCDSDIVTPHMTRTPSFPFPSLWTVRMIAVFDCSTVRLFDSPCHLVCTYTHTHRVQSTDDDFSLSPGSPLVNSTVNCNSTVRITTACCLQLLATYSKPTSSSSKPPCIHAACSSIYLRSLIYYRFYSN
jgi:hypothetical protein